MTHKAIIFDLFGTLIYNFSKTEFDETVSRMGRAVGAPEADFLRLWVGTYAARCTGQFTTIESNIELICHDLGFAATDDQIAAAFAIRLDFTRRWFRPHPGSVETLTEIRALGLKTGLISDCTPEVPAFWPSTPFAPLIDVPIFSPTAGCKKPDPRIYLLACDQLGVDPSDCLYVGDGSSRELTGAANVGMQPVLLKMDYGAADDSYRVEEDDWQGAAISSLEDILRLLRFGDPEAGAQQYQL